MPKKKCRQIITIENRIGVKKTYLNLWTVLGLGALLLGGTHYFEHTFEKKSTALDQKIEKAKKEAKELEGIIKSELFMENPKNQVAFLPENDALKNAQHSFAGELSALIENHMHGIWIKSIHLNRRTHKGTILAYTEEPAIVDEYVDKIEKLDALKPYNLHMTSLQESDYLNPPQKSKKKRKKKKKASTNALHTYRFVLETKEEEAK